MSGKSITRTALILGTVGLLTMSLVGCASKAASPAAGPSLAANEPGPTDPPAVATAILVRSGGLQVVDSAGDVLEAVTYFDPIADVVAVLSTATGSDPVVEKHSGGTESSPGTSYVWDGLRLEVGRIGETAVHHSTMVRLEGSPLTVTHIMAPVLDWEN